MTEIGTLVWLRMFPLNIEVKIQLMVPSGPAVSFQWPRNDECFWVPFHHILCCINTPITTTGRTYTITNEENYKMNDLYAKVTI